eukprot:3363348-Rhodomonas_salina.3
MSLAAPQPGPGGSSSSCRPNSEELGRADSERGPPSGEVWRPRWLRLFRGLRGRRLADAGEGGSLAVAARRELADLASDPRKPFPPPQSGAVTGSVELCVSSGHGRVGLNAESTMTVMARDKGDDEWRYNNDE